MANQEAFESGIGIGKGDAKKKKIGGRSESGAGGAEDAAKAIPSTFKHGGKVKKTGKAKVHKGEVVLTAKEARKVGKKKTARTAKYKRHWSQKKTARKRA